MLELYRYLKLTRLVEERLVNLYRQTKVVGGVFRSLGQEATASALLTRCSRRISSRR
jgi:TPP-dependent pyruvate/acetoin dehydrogenase alpha subunit